MSCTIHGLLDTAYAGSLAFGKFAARWTPTFIPFYTRNYVLFCLGPARIGLEYQNVSEVTNRFEYDVNLMLGEGSSLKREKFYI